MTFSERDFRNCLGSFTTGITIATTADSDKNPCGVTINSFTSVSLKPPLILFNLGKESYHHETFTHAEGFVMNILSEQQITHAQLFANSFSSPWDAIDHGKTPNGLPALKGCAALLECERYAVYEGGDHSIIVGKVTHLEYHHDAFPLLYFRGKYHTIGHPAEKQEK